MENIEEMGKLLVIDLRGERIQGLALKVEKFDPLQDRLESNSFNEMFVRKFVSWTKLRLMERK